MFLRILLILIVIAKCSSQQKVNDDQKCGVKLKASGLVVNGTASEKNEWPWLASIMHFPSKKFICGGSIISAYYVLTAAHCINNKQKRTIFDRRELLVYLGKHNLSEDEDNSVFFQPHEILIHPDWTADQKRFDADLAVIVAEEKIEFSSTILPVCLWSDLEEDQNYEGTVVGWGASEKTGLVDYTDIPYKVQVRRVPNEKCYESFHLIASIASSRTFCASGVKKSSGPCTGDSGGGFFVENNKVWYIQGIVSASLVSRTSFCEYDKYSLFTTVKEFLSWKNLRNKAYEVELQGIVMMAINRKGKTSTYKTAGLTITQPSGIVIFGRRKPSMNVNTVEIRDQHIVYLPNGFGSLFDRLEELKVIRSNLRFIERENFQNMTSLKQLNFNSNPIENIPNDAFHDLTNLLVLQITGSKLAYLHKFLLVNNTKLQHLDLKLNNIESLPPNLFRNNLKLEYLELGNNRIKFINEPLFDYPVNLKVINIESNIIQEVSPNAFIRLTSLTGISLVSNRLKSLHVDTFANNKDLTDLWVGFNQIDDFPAGLTRNNLKLEKITFAFNKVKKLQKGLFENLGHLKNVELAGMNLNELPIEFLSSLSDLEVLRIFDNNLNTLNKDLLANNTQLTHFNAAFNKISELDETFFKNNLNLDTIVLSNNQLKTIKRGLFKNLEALEDLRLHFNLIESIEVDTFSDLTSLKKLYLKDNNLRVLDENLFNHLVKLEFLDMSSNSIEHLPAKLFKNNLKLSTISFNYNNIKRIDVKFNPNRHFRRLGFYGNICINKFESHVGTQADFIAEIEEKCSGKTETS